MRKEGGGGKRGEGERRDSWMVRRKCSPRAIAGPGAVPSGNWRNWQKHCLGQRGKA